MKHLTHIILLSVVLSLFGCSDRRATSVLNHADSLLSTCPDTVLVILDSLRAERSSDMSRRQKMRLELLRADAQNKAFVNFTTDSVMREVTAYYDAHGTAQERMRAHYLLGCTYRDMGDAPRALECYHDAIDKADTTSADCDYKLLSRVYGQMAGLYSKQYLPDEEIKMLLNYSKYSLKANDTLNYIRGMEFMVRPYFDLEDTATIIKITQECSLLYKRYGYVKASASVYPTLIYLYLKQHKYIEARYLMDVFETESGLFDSNNNIASGREHYYYSKGLYYYGVNKLDSADYYFRKLENYGYLHDSYKGLAMVYVSKGITDSIIKYSDLYVEAAETHFSNLQIKDVKKISALYDYNKQQVIIAQKSAEASRNKLIAITISILLFVLTFVSVYVYNIFMKKKKREYNHLNNRYVRIKNQYEEIQKRKDEMKLIESENNLCKSQIFKLFVLKSTPKKGHVPPSQEEWNELIVHIKEYLPIFYNLVFIKNKLSDQELYTTILTRLNFKNSEISILLGIKPQQVTNNKTKANFKLFGNNGATSFRKNLKTYINVKDM